MTAADFEFLGQCVTRQRIRQMFTQSSGNQDRYKKSGTNFLIGEVKMITGKFSEEKSQKPVATFCATLDLSALQTIGGSLGVTDLTLVQTYRAGFKEVVWDHAAISGSASNAEIAMYNHAALAQGTSEYQRTRFTQPKYHFGKLAVVAQSRTECPRLRTHRECREANSVHSLVISAELPGGVRLVSLIGIGTVPYMVRPVKITVVYGGDPDVTVTVKWFYGYGTAITAVFWDNFIHNAATI
ncbi:hypothetical protein B0H19DRAFT_1072259 [Mycena capillaripes]|nr:hypothetical protein B0H19DRAFT_1072259 [Mycena capillaripes]